MPYEKEIKRLKELSEQYDPEIAHEKADEILCEILLDLGFVEIVKAYSEIGKWYA